MSGRAIILILLILSGVVAAGAAYFSLQSPPPVALLVPAHMYVAAADTIPTGALIKPQDVKFLGPTPSVSPESSFERTVASSPDDQKATDQKSIGEVVGAVARQRFEAGDPITRGAVVKPGDSGFLAAVLRPGMRAITVGVTAVSGTAGLIYPGDKVDVILTQTFQQGALQLDRRSAAEVVAENLRVLAIDQQMQRAPADAGQPAARLAQTVTLEADPRQAEEIALATKLGDLSLTIRSLDGPAAQASPTHQAVWASDVSQALGVVAKEGAASQTPGALSGVTIMRGDAATTALGTNTAGR